MEHRRAETLFQKYLAGEIDSDELSELDVLLEDDNIAKKFREYIKLNRGMIEYHYSSTTPGKEFVLPKREKSFSASYLKYAAVFIILVGSGLMLTFFNGTGAGTVPFGEAVTLTISDSITKTIGHGDEIIVDLGNVNVVQQGDTISYVVKEAAKELVYNEVRVPYGKKIVLQLSDHSFVTLNSGTTLKYPTNFLSEGKRVVYLQGEAYFQVARDTSRPFVARTNHLDITVLGTEFNVKAYPEDGVQQTVLVEGVVAVKKSGDSSSVGVILKPNMLASFDVKEAVISTEKVNPASYVAWLQGKLIFEKEEFSSIAKTLERKYDVEIEILNDALAREKFSARIEGNNIEEILEYFSASYPFTYTVNGKKYTIREK